jgi:hypothetical protein
MRRRKLIERLTWKPGDIDIEPEDDVYPARAEWEARETARGYAAYLEAGRAIGEEYMRTKPDCDDGTLSLAAHGFNPEEVESAVWDDEGDLVEVVMRDGRRIVPGRPRDCGE